MSSTLLRVPKGANMRKNIVGRGRASGNGKTSGRGHNGQNSRSGGGVRPGFEGGQMPLYRRVASRGFSNHPFKKDFVVIDLDSIARVYNEGDTVNIESLCKHRLIKKSEKRIKILGSGNIDKKLNFDIGAISLSARTKIEKVGGAIVAPSPKKI